MGNPSNPELAASSDPLMTVVAEVIAELLEERDEVAPLDVLIRLEVLDDEKVETWRRGGMPYLERSVTAGLARVARLLRLVHAHARDLGLQPVPRKYATRGKGPKRRLRFSKRGDRESELAYSTHFVRVRAATSASEA